MARWFSIIMAAAMGAGCVSVRLHSVGKVPPKPDGSVAIISSCPLKAPPCDMFIKAIDGETQPPPATDEIDQYIIAPGQHTVEMQSKDRFEPRLLGVDMQALGGADLQAWGGIERRGPRTCSLTFAAEAGKRYQVLPTGRWSWVETDSESRRTIYIAHFSPTLLNEAHEHVPHTVAGAFEVAHGPTSLEDPAAYEWLAAHRAVDEPAELIIGKHLRVTRIIGEIGPSDRLDIGNAVLARDYRVPPGTYVVTGQYVTDDPSAHALGTASVSVVAAPNAGYLVDAVQEENRFVLTVEPLQ